MKKFLGMLVFSGVVVATIAACSAGRGTGRANPSAEWAASASAGSTVTFLRSAPTTTAASSSTSAAPVVNTNPATGHLLKQVGETFTILPEPRAADADPGATKVVVNKISRGKKGMYGPTLRMDVTVTTGNNSETNENGREFLCSTPSSVDPGSGEEVAGRGGFMVSDNPPLKLGTNHTYHCTFDVESLHDHGWLVLGPYRSQVDYPYDLR